MTTSGLVCYALKDGTVVWQTKDGFANSGPLVLNDVVYLVLNDGPTAFKATTGQMIWKQSKLDSRGNNSLMPWTSGGTNYLIIASAGSGGNLFCLDAATGEIAWKAPEESRGSLGEGVYTTPVVVGDNVYVYWCNLLQFKISTQAAAQTGKWNLGGGDRDGSPIIYQGNAYVVQHGFRKCMDIKTGDVKWAQPNPPLQNSLSSPILADGKIIATLVASHEGGGDVLMYKATPEKYEACGQFSPHVVECSSPAIANGKLFLRCEDSIRCYDLTK
jgi:outer membrane protein assembly factor BamB